MHKNLKTAFGERLKEIRKAKGFTQERLAEVLDISQRQLTRIETGDNFPSVETLERISLYLETDLKDLFDFVWDKEYAVLSTGTDERPVFEVSVTDDVINLERYKKSIKPPSKLNEDCINIENSEQPIYNYGISYSCYGRNSAKTRSKEDFAHESIIILQRIHEKLYGKPLVCIRPFI